MHDPKVLVHRSRVNKAVFQHIRKGLHALCVPKLLGADGHFRSAEVARRSLAAGIGSLKLTRLPFVSSKLISGTKLPEELLAKKTVRIFIVGFPFVDRSFFFCYVKKGLASVCSSDKKPFRSLGIEVRLLCVSFCEASRRNEKGTQIC